MDGFELTEKALAYLNKWNKSQGEVRKYLTKYAENEEDLEATMAYLEELGLVNDNKYCETYIDWALTKPYGKIKIEHDLLKKGIESQVIQSALEEHYPYQLENKVFAETAQTLYESIFEKSGLPEKLKALEENHKAQLKEKNKALSKLGRKLGALGFDPEMIQDYMENLIERV